MTQTTCPKCTGTGFVSAFAHIKNGVCFDCDGTGRVSVPVAGDVDLKAARAVGDAALAGDDVTPAAAAAAFAFFEDLGPGRWAQKDYDRRNTLLRITTA